MHGREIGEAGGRARTPCPLRPSARAFTFPHPVAQCWLASKRPTPRACGGAPSCLSSAAGSDAYLSSGTDGATLLSSAVGYHYASLSSYTPTSPCTRRASSRYLHRDDAKVDECVANTCTRERRGGDECMACQHTRVSAWEEAAWEHGHMHWGAWPYALV